VRARTYVRMKHDVRLTDDAIRARAKQLIRACGPNAAAATLGVNRITALSLAAGAPVMASTFALVRERLSEREGTAAP
jgi:hypothetical protein